MDFFKDKWKGILACLILALPCWFLGKAVPVVGAPVFGILLGMALMRFLPAREQLKGGIAFTSKKVLQYAVILLGFGLNLSVVLETGVQSLPIICSTIAISLIMAWILQKALHVPSNLATLIGVGSSICGGSAVAAQEETLKYILPSTNRLQRHSALQILVGLVKSAALRQSSNETTQ